MRPLLIASILFIMAGNYGCSVGMAMSGKDDPNMALIRVGASRGEIELTLGPPINTVSIEAGRRIDVYEYEIGNEPSAGRAIGHGIMDVLTLGIWEVVGTPIEGFQGTRYQIQLTYDEQDKVIAINQAAPSASQLQEAKDIEDCDPTTGFCI